MQSVKSKGRWGLVAAILAGALLAVGGPRSAEAAGGRVRVVSVPVVVPVYRPAIAYAPYYVGPEQWVVNMWVNGVYISRTYVAHNSYQATLQAGQEFPFAQLASVAKVHY
ncbi:MAG: hypothetical protein R3E01_27395 [Pirellulaceae bacterium]|nr:hypothetical protein [Planctomycetales bacterium]